MIMPKNILKDFVEAPAIEKVVRLSGGTAVLAKFMGVTPKTVREWVKDPCKLPRDRAVQLSLLTLNTMRPHDFRPDLFPESVNSNEISAFPPIGESYTQMMA
jgi:DNA-binding transcriptional regulator YdaS (Cro superfamily)